MRVLFVTNMWPEEERPWYGNYIHSQAQSLLARGLDLDILVMRGHASRWEYARGAGRVLARNLSSHYSVIHAHYGYSGMVARLDLRAPLVISYCGDDLLGTPDPARPTRMRPRSRALAAAFAQVGRVASATITKSKAMERRLPRSIRGRNHVIPNGVDLEAFAPMDQRAARQSLGWPQDERVALFVGNPRDPRKNYPLAAGACSAASRTCPGLLLRVAHGVDPQVISLYMNAADVLVFPSLSEGSPNVIKEAMACELPIVATPVGDVPERLGGVAGCAVVPHDERVFAAAIEACLGHGRSPEARAAVAALSMERIAERVEQLYRSVAQRRRGSLAGAL
jgi:teichuronic acid biosynthesis glycosyltransferase TuaC